MRAVLGIGVLVVIVVAVVSIVIEPPRGEQAQTLAEEIIEGDLAGEAGLTGVVAECENPGDGRVETFRCTAETDQGTVRFDARMDDDETPGEARVSRRSPRPGLHVSVSARNLYPPEALRLLELEAVETLGDRFGPDVSPEDLHCGDDAVLLEEVGDRIPCTFRDPDAPGDVYDATMGFALAGEDTDELSPLVRGGIVDLVVADEPR